MNNNYDFILIPDNEKLISMAKATNNDRIINKAYDKLVKEFIRQRYSQDKVEAIMNNYLDDMENTNYYNEFKELQAYRKACKEYAKELLGME